MITGTFLILTWVLIFASWRRDRKMNKRYPRLAKPLHKVYDLVAVDDTTVTVVCADCWQPLGTATITGWRGLAEAHWREVNTHGPRFTR
jgi:hypothetical protein